METDSSSSSSSSSSEALVHLLPCKIAYDGSAPISAYFKPSGDTGTAFFRGRELKGKVVDVPIGMVGNCVVRTNKKVSVSGNFHTVTVWQHDVVPGSGVMADCFNAMEISKKVLYRYSI